MTSTISIPAAPGGLPDDIATQWQEAYAKAFEAAMERWAHDPDRVSRTASEVAGMLLATPDLGSYEEAMALPAWHFVLRAPSADGKTLRVVTRHGKPYTFPVGAA